jgi:hypothetical protein
VFETGASLTQACLIVNKVYDELIRTVLVLIKKLDLSIRKKINKEALNVSFITKNYCDLKLQLDILMCHMFKWFQDNQFALNIDKTNIIKFTPTTATCYPLNLMVDDKSFSEAETVKFLGLQLDNHLTCKEHTDL